MFFNGHPLRALKCVAAEIISVNTPPSTYANVRFSIPHIIGDMNIYDEHTYVIINAGNIPINAGFFSRNRYTVMHHSVSTASVWLHQAK